MQKALTLLICGLLITPLFAQDIPVRKPEIGPVPELGEGVRKAFDRRDALLQKSNRTPAEEDEMWQLLEKYPEQYATMWDLVGGGDSWYNAGGPYQVTASSELAPQGSNTYHAGNAHDLSLKNAWVEGKPGYGIGEYLEYRFDNDSPRITEVKIYNGYVKTPQAWERNARVKQLRMSVNGEPFALLNLEDSRALQTFTFDPLGRRPDGKDLVLRFTITGVYEGTHYEDVVLTELFFDGLDVLCFPAGTLIAMADGNTRRIEAISEGDEILAYDTHLNRQLTAVVEETATIRHAAFAELRFSDGTVITCTPDHPFFTADGHWASLMPEKTQTHYQYEAVAMLLPGEECLLRQTDEPELTSVELRAIRRFTEPQPTYTILRLSRGDAFFANGLLVGTEPLRRVVNLPKQTATKR